MGSPARVYGRRDRVMMQQVEGDSVLLDIDTGEYFSLNEVGGRVWELCDGTRSVESIADAICTEYDVERATAMRDADELLADLAGAGLVVE
ncbi:MAG: PqqD family protein [Acidimicrobiales bacterium]